MSVAPRNPAVSLPVRLPDGRIGAEDDNGVATVSDCHAVSCWSAPAGTRTQDPRLGRRLHAGRGRARAPDSAVSRRPSPTGAHPRAPDCLPGCLPGPCTGEAGGEQVLSRGRPGRDHSVSSDSAGGTDGGRRTISTYSVCRTASACTSAFPALFTMSPEPTGPVVNSHRLALWPGNGRLGALGAQGRIPCRRGVLAKDGLRPHSRRIHSLPRRSA